MLSNLPEKSVFTLGSCVSSRKYQVCSRSVCCAPGAEITLLSFDAGEGVSAELYTGDTLYTVLEGSCVINAGAPAELTAGESIIMPRETLHTLSCTQPFKVLQLTAGKGEGNMKKLIDHIPHKEAIALKDQIDYEPGQVASMTLCNQPQIGMTLFAFDQGTQIGTHAAPGDAMPTILEGEAEITISGTTYTVKAGESIVMPAGEPHSLKALTRFKMLLVLVKE